MNRTVIALLLVLSVVLTGCTRQSVQQAEPTALPTVYPWPITSQQTAGSEWAQVQTSNTHLTLAIADTQAERTKGLGERDSLPQDGMLFVIDPARTTDIWMKGMRFSIDVVWLKNGEVIWVEPSLAVPDPAEAFPPSYGPVEPVDAVIEVAAGSAQKVGLTKGATVSILGFE